MIQVSQNEFECVDGSMNFWKNLKRITISYFGRWMLCLYVSVWVHEYLCSSYGVQQRKQIPRAGVSGGCEPFDLDTEK